LGESEQVQNSLDERLRPRIAGGGKQLQGIRADRAQGGVGRDPVLDRERITAQPAGVGVDLGLDERDHVRASGLDRADREQPRLGDHERDPAPIALGAGARSDVETRLRPRHLPEERLEVLRSALGVRVRPARRVEDRPVLGEHQALACVAGWSFRTCLANSPRGPSAGSMSFVMPFPLMGGRGPLG
jgi:hypothetical protein